MSSLPHDVWKLLQRVDYIYDYDKSGRWIGEFEVDYTWPNGRMDQIFGVYFTDEGYGTRGNVPDELNTNDMIMATVITLELANVELELPEKLK
jgi:hypothetical protein